VRPCTVRTCPVPLSCPGRVRPGHGPDKDRARQVQGTGQCEAIPVVAGDPFAPLAMTISVVPTQEGDYPQWRSCKSAACGILVQDQYGSDKRCRSSRATYSGQYRDPGAARQANPRCKSRSLGLDTVFAALQTYSAGARSP
jgi:hypothetical protein